MATDPAPARTPADLISATLRGIPHPPATEVPGCGGGAVAWPVPLDGRAACAVAFVEDRDSVRIALVLKDAASLGRADVRAIAHPSMHRTFDEATVFSDLASYAYNNVGGRSTTDILPALVESLARPDPLAVKAMRAGRHYDGRTWLWLSCAASGRRNRGFAARHPWLAGSAAHSAIPRRGNKPPPSRLSRDALARRELTDMMFTPKVWRHGDLRVAVEALRGLVLPNGPVHLDDPYIAGVCHMPRALWPARVRGKASQDDLAAFYVLARLVHACALASRREYGSVIGRMDGWAAYAASLHGRSGLAASHVPGNHARVWDDASRPVGAVADMVEAFAEQVVAPAMRLAGASQPKRGLDEGVEILGLLKLTGGGWGGTSDGHREAALRLLLGDRTLPRLCEVSARWHSRASAIQRAVAALPGFSGFAGPLAFEPTDLGDGIEARCLNDAAGLLDEGARGADADGVGGLAHCVASYLPRVVAGKTTIVSLRVRDGSGTRRLSTAEVAFSYGTHRVIQHRGLANAPPPPEAVAALGRLLPEVSDLAGSRIGRWKAPAFDPVAAVARPDSWDAVARLWDFALPRPLRGLDPAGLADAAGLDAGQGSARHAA